jgi:hypothetical protein
MSGYWPLTPTTSRPYSSLMNQTQTISHTLTRQTRTAYAEFMNPATRYEKVYFQVDVYADGKYLNFGFVDDENDTEAIDRVVRGILEWANTPDSVLESMHSRFD